MRLPLTVAQEIVAIEAGFKSWTELKAASASGAAPAPAVAVSNVKALFEEYQGRGVVFAQRLTRQAWGGIDFHVRDPAGNVISFVQFRSAVGSGQRV